MSNIHFPHQSESSPQSSADVPVSISSPEHAVPTLSEASARDFGGAILCLEVASQQARSLIDHVQNERVRAELLKQIDVIDLQIAEVRRQIASLLRRFGPSRTSPRPDGPLNRV